MAFDIPDLDTDKLKISFMKSALDAICHHLEGGFDDSAHSIVKACLIGIEFGTHSPEFIAISSIEKARLKSGTDQNG